MKVIQKKKMVLIAAIVLVIQSIGMTQSYTPRILNITDSPVFSTTRTIANEDSLSHKEGFAKGYSIYPVIYKLHSEPWINPMYKVDMNNDGIWETNWLSDYELVGSVQIFV